MTRRLSPGVVVGGLVGALVALSPVLTLVLCAAAAGVWLCLQSPSWVVGLMFVGLLFDRLGVTGVKLGDFPVTASKLSVVGAVVIWGLHALLNGAPLVRGHRVFWGLLGLVTTTAITIAIANTMHEGKFVLYGLLMMGVMVAISYTALVEDPNPRVLRWMAVVFALALLNSVRGASGRASGPMGDPNEWATVVLLVTPTLLGVLVDDSAGIAAAVRYLLPPLAALSVLRSESRAALVVGILVSPVIFWLLRRRRLQLLVSGVGAILVAPWFVDMGALLARFHKLVANLQGAAVQQDTSLEERSELFRQGVQLFRDHWLVGAGPGNFAAASGFVSHEGTLRPAHNSYLEVASEQGILGLAALLAFGSIVAITLRTAWRESGTEQAKNRVIGVSAGLAAFALMAATLGLVTFAMGYFVLGLALAFARPAEAAPVR